MKGEFVENIGDGRFAVAYSDRTVWLIDNLTGSKIVIYYHPYHERWYIMLTDPQGNFLKRLRYISACATAVFEYCARSQETGNLYVDVLYCEPVHEEELNSYWQPWRPILTAYRMGNRRPYYRWLRSIIPDVAKYVATRIRESLVAAEFMAADVIYFTFGVEPDYVGYLITGTKYCARVLYGVYCRMQPPECEPTACRHICSIVALQYAEECSNQVEQQCLAGEIFKPISKREYMKEVER